MLFNIKTHTLEPIYFHLAIITIALEMSLHSLAVDLLAHRHVAMMM
jgi:hypothetical protein